MRREQTDTSHPERTETVKDVKQQILFLYVSRAFYHNALSTDTTLLNYDFILHYAIPGH